MGFRCVTHRESGSRATALHKKRAALRLLRWDPSSACGGLRMTGLGRERAFAGLRFGGNGSRASATVSEIVAAAREQGSRWLRLRCVTHRKSGSRATALHKKHAALRLLRWDPSSACGGLRMTGLERERALAEAGFGGGRRKSGGKPPHSTKEWPAPEGGPYKGRKKIS